MYMYVCVSFPNFLAFSIIALIHKYNKLPITWAMKENVAKFLSSKQYSVIILRKFRTRQLSVTHEDHSGIFTIMWLA